MDDRTQPAALSVILCTHNPREHFLEKVLAALRSQTLHRQLWELVVVDNGSCPPLEGRIDLTWHSHARVVGEVKLGLTFARLRGLTESSAALLIYVDDDNVLAPDYLKTALRIANEHPRVGVWSGRVELQFETPPADWTRRYWPFLAERLVDRDATTSEVRLVEPLPVGAGLCVRREAMQRYMEKVMEDPLRQALDRSGTLLSSGGDTDIGLTVCEGGWERGAFKDLHVRHLIPPERCMEEYLARLAGGISFSTSLLTLIHEPHVPPAPTNLWWWIKYGCDCATKVGRRRRFFRSCKSAHRMARALYERSLADERIRTARPVT